MRQTDNITHIFLKPGELVVGAAECRIHALLGSCVSIALWHPERKIGAMSHAAIPTRGDKKKFPLDPRYSDEVLTLLSLNLEMLGIDIRECQANVYGGSEILLSIPGQPESMDTGRINAEITKRQLADYGMAIKQESLLGARYRKIVFDVSTGEVCERQMNEEGNPA